MSETKVLYMTGAGAPSQDENALAHAEAMLELLIAHGLDRAVARAHPRSWHQGALYAQSSNIYTRSLGYSIMLTAAVNTPDVAARLLASVRDAAQGVFDDGAA